MPSSNRFRSVIEAARGGGAVARVPEEIASALGGMRQMRVTGTINGRAFQSSTMPYHGALYLGVHKATREAARVAIGDEVEITVARDTRPRTLTLAPELEAAFARSPALRARFDALSFTRRKELADPVAIAKRPETRAARLARALDALRQLQ